MNDDQLYIIVTTRVVTLFGQTFSDLRRGEGALLSSTATQHRVFSSIGLVGRYCCWLDWRFYFLLISGFLMGYIHVLPQSSSSERSLVKNVPVGAAPRRPTRVGSTVGCVRVALAPPFLPIVCLSTFYSRPADRRFLMVIPLRGDIVNRTEYL